MVSKSNYPRLLLTLVPVLMIASVAGAQERRQVPELRTYGQAASVEEVENIDDLINRYKETWGEQDVDGYIALHAKDSEWINAYARMFQSDTDLAHFIEHRLFPAFDANVSKQEASNMKIVSIRYMSNAAVVHMYTDGSRGPSRTAGEQLRRTHLHLILEMQNDAWRIVHTAIMDAR